MAGGFARSGENNAEGISGTPSSQRPVLVWGKSSRTWVNLPWNRRMSLSPNLATPPPPPAQPPSPPPQSDHSGRWLHRADLFLRVMVRLYIGLILFFLPWTHLWTFNRFFLYYAPVAHLVESGALRGVVSGLGLLNLWIAISEAIHYKEN